MFSSEHLNLIKRKELDENLKVLKTDIKDNEDINKMTDIFNTITRKITLIRMVKSPKEALVKILQYS